MGWIKRRPRVSSVQGSKHLSPMTEKLLKDSKKSVLSKDDRTTTTPHVPSMAPRKRALRS